MDDVENFTEWENQFVNLMLLFLSQIGELMLFESEFEERLKRLRARASREARRRRIRRRRRLQLLQLLSYTRVRRTVGRKERPQGSVFWSQVTNVFDDNEWLSHFRMTRRTFDFVFKKLEPYIRGSSRTNRGQPFDRRIKLAVALWWYATPCEYRSISDIFGIGIATVFVAVRQVTRALRRSLLKRFIRLPRGQRLQENIDGFKERGYPMCAGAMGGTHIPIVTPQDDSAAYFNRRGWHSIILQAVVDHNSRFIDVFAGWPGGAPDDAHVLMNSPIFRTAEEQGGFLFPRETSITVNSVEVPVHLIADPSYPLMNWLMKGFPHDHALSPSERQFNLRLSSAQAVVEEAFGRLKGRWTCLAKRTDVVPSFVTDVAVACCVLHNICESRNEDYLAEWDNEQRPFGEPLAMPDGRAAGRQAQAVRESVLSLL